MPPISRQRITQVILDAIHESGGVGMLMDSTAAHPRPFLVARNGQQVSIWVYCWNLTHGGRSSLPDEFRIQMTTVASPLAMNPSGHTVLLGYESDRGVFSGFDIIRHQEFTSGSPSVQVSRLTLDAGLQEGLAFQTKSNDEIAIGIRSDLFLFYCEHARQLHQLGDDAVYLESAERAVRTHEIDDRELLVLPEPRRMVIRETSRWSRSSSFRMQVLNAYDNRCAVTRCKLRLVDAAHILPVQAGDESIDHVRNGIALSPTYHRAFDRGLIFLDENMEMRVNDVAVTNLARIGLDSGIENFGSYLGRIHLPYNPEQRPDPHFIRLANKYRKVR